MRLALPLLALAVVIAIPAGCGSSSDQTGSATTAESQAGTSTAPGASTAPPGASARTCSTGKAKVEGLRATGTTCTEARHLMLRWLVRPACKPPQGASRMGCVALPYLCLATATGRGWSVSCAKPGRSIAFIVRRG